MHRPLVSIVIPTHNRSQYAIESIASILAMPGSDFELVMSDTSNENALADVFGERFSSYLEDSRFKYHRPTEKLDMTGNHNFCLSKATGEFICLIGDDDTVTADLLFAAQWAKDNNVDVVAPKITSNYAWPDFFSNTFKWAHASRLYIPKSLSLFRRRNSKEVLNSWLAAACQGTEGLPKIYHGLVKKDVIDDICSVTKEFFFGSSPDVSGAVALVTADIDYVEIDYPITIPGASGGSNTGRSAVNTHKGKLSDEGQTSGATDATWDARVPKFFSVETVWAHAATETLKHGGRVKVDDFGFMRLYSLCLLRHPEYRADIMTSVRAYCEQLGLGVNRTLIAIYAQMLPLVFSRVIYVFRRLMFPTASGGRKYIPDVVNIFDASVQLDEYLRKKKWSWEKFVGRVLG